MKQVIYEYADGVQVIVEMSDEEYAKLMGQEQAETSKEYYDEEPQNVGVSTEAALNLKMFEARKQADKEKPPIIKSDKPFSKLIDETLSKVTDSVKEFMDKLGQTDLKPSEISMSFGLSFTAEAGAIVAKASTGTQFKVQLKWKLEK